VAKFSVGTFIDTAKVLPPSITVLLRGPTGIGKSYIVRQLAQYFGLPVIDRRLSQMTEGDVLGLPSTEGTVTRFNPPDWYKRACIEPVVLFLDEFNRATIEVMQAGFQIVLDHELNGHVLHPATRVFAAVNTGSEYAVNEMDPALQRRFWIADLVPTVEDWLAYAKDMKVGIDPIIIDFIAQNEKWLDPGKQPELGEVFPTRASWERYSQSLQLAKIDSDPEDPRYYSLGLGFVGTEASMAFNQFAKTYNAQVTGEDIFERYAKVKHKLSKLGQERWNICIERLGKHCEHVKRCSTAQALNIRDFMVDLPAELRVVLWNKLVSAGAKKIEFIQAMHEHTKDIICKTFGAETTDTQPEAAAEKK
jgi:hypothetical protein